MSIKKTTKNFKKNKYHHQEFSADYDYTEAVVVNNFNLNEESYKDLNFTSLNFINCRFENVDIWRWTFFACSFENCRFIGNQLQYIDFIECLFIDCTISFSTIFDMKFIDCEIKDFKFLKCSEVNDLVFANDNIENILFSDSNLYHAQFDRFTHGHFKNFLFEDNYLKSCLFTNVDFEESFFLNCKFELSSFMNSKMHKNVFRDHCAVDNEAYCSIDLQSILLSDNQPIDVLKNIFGIHSDNIKQYIADMTTPILYYKVFISYSFADKAFVRKMNDALRLKGVSTFLWENDAPGGKSLKKIMSENIEKNDKILFIASENSIKSQACRYELTEGRKKQDKLWKTIFFPIHIDNYLFTVKKEDVRPRDMREEYWQNILDLREINSSDFSEFRYAGTATTEFEKKTNEAN